MTLASTASLVDALRQYRLLEPAQVEEVAHAFGARFLAPRALAGELIRRGWLTPFQANQLLQGRGHELLLGSYVLLERLGEGGMGQVFKARHRNLKRLVALKVIHNKRLDNPEAVRRFQREVRAAAALSHPNVVLAYDADHIGDTHLLVMEYVEGIDLARFVRKSGPLPVAQACALIGQVALGLQHAHERGLVHRDVKPSNLLLTANGASVKILDMGLALRSEPPAGGEASGTMTREGEVMGTLDFLSPEQARESHTVDIRSDLYSLGCTFYYLLSGRVPFPGGTLMDKLLRHKFDEPRPVEELRPEVPPAVAAVVRKLMAKKPEDRFQTPAEVAAALTTCPGAASGTSPTAAGTGQAVGGGPAGTRPKEEPLDTTLVQMVQSVETEAMETSHRPRQAARERRRLLYAVAGSSLVLVGAVALLYLLFKNRGGTETPAHAGGHSAIAVAPSTKKPKQVDDPWPNQVAVMPAEQQVGAVVARLKALNPGFDGKVTYKIDNGVVTELQFLADEVTDLAPLRVLAGLKALACSGSSFGKGRLSDLSPLKGMRLTALWCYGTQASDLSPLTGMPLTTLGFNGLDISDLSPLKGMPLKYLNCGGTKVRDLSPLTGMPLQSLDCRNTKVSDLGPLKDLPLKELWCDFMPQRDAEILRSIKTLEKINGKPAQEFWKEVELKKRERK
jgi:tRNA A-37 threonylcarbamoyl transferase component Bud32